MSGRWVEEAIGIVRSDQQEVAALAAAKTLADEIDRLHGLLASCLNDAAKWRASQETDEDFEEGLSKAARKVYRDGLRHARAECAYSIESRLQNYK